MRKVFLLGLVLLPLLVTSCKKEYVSSEPLRFNLYLFSSEGVDLVNPSNPSAIEAQFLDLSLTWKPGGVRCYLDGEEVVSNLSGFYYYNFYTPDLAEGLDELKNTSFECTIHNEGFPDSKARFYFDTKGWLCRVDINGKRVLEPVSSSYNCNVKLVF